jgi:hypothetical protein
MKSTLYKNLVAKWLFAALLILSFFTFSGLISPTQTNPDQLQTTLVVNSGSRNIKSINYKRALIPEQRKYLSFLSFVNADHLYVQQVKVRIKELGAIVLVPQIALFYRVKTIPQSIGDEPNNLIG